MRRPGRPALATARSGWQRQSSMKEVSDAFLLGLSEVVATLIGFLLVAMFFYIDRRRDQELAAAWERGSPYLRAGVTMVLLLYALALAVSLGLVVLETRWVVVVFAVMSVAVVISGIDVTRRHRDLTAVAHIRGTSPWLVWAVLAVVLLAPWIAGAFQPGRSELTIAALLAGAFAFANTVGFLLSAFDLERITRGQSPART